MLDLKELRCFISVYELKGFARAAADLNTVQSNVSARIRRLEDEIGAPLFERLHRSIRPTAKGEIMYRYATRVLAEVSELEAAMRVDRQVA
jgi:LysR family transcriptional regulator, cell division regulator